MTKFPVSLEEWAESVAEAVSDPDPRAYLPGLMVVAASILLVT